MNNREKELIEKSESHVVIFFLLRLLLLLSRSSFSSRGRPNTGPYCGDQGLQVTGLKGLSEESWPIWLNINTGSLQDGGQLLGGDGNIVIGEDEGGVHAGEFRVGHFYFWVRKFP